MQTGKNPLGETDINRKKTCIYENKLSAKKHSQISNKRKICINSEDEQPLKKQKNRDEHIGMVDEYANDIFEYFYQKEFKMIPTFNYLKDEKSKYHIRSSTRAIVIDWLIKVHQEFHYVQETLLLALTIIDKFLSMNQVALSKLQLLAVTSLFIASKYEEINLPKLSNYAYITDGAASMNDIIIAETFILKSLKFDISWPSPLNFIRRISKADHHDVETKNLAKYIMENIYCSPHFIHLKSSYISALAMYIARKIVKNSDSTWNENFIHYSGGIDAENETQFQNYYKQVVNELAKPSTKLESLFTKYSKEAHHNVYPVVKEWCMKQTSIK